MKHLLASAALFLLALLVGARADEYRFGERFERSAPLAANGTVEVKNVNGDIEVTAWDRDEIKVEGEKRAATEEELKQIELTIELAPQHAEVRVHLPKRAGSVFGGSTIRASVHLKLSVPRNAVLDRISSVNSTVTITDVHGAVHAESVNGQVRATGLASSASLRTVNGSLHAEFGALADGASIRAESVNGSVTLRLPKDAGVKLHLSTVNGGLKCDFPLTSENRHWRHLDGVIGNGAAKLDASTVNGGISVLSR